MAESKKADDEKESGSQSAVQEYWEEHASRIIGSMAITVFLVGTVVYRFAEDWSWVDSFYFSAVALTTVGFGDLHPTTDVTKIFTIFYIFSGVALITAVLNQLLKRMAGRATERAASK